MPGIAVETIVASIATIAIAAITAAITRGRRVVRGVVMGALLDGAALGVASPAGEGPSREEPPRRRPASQLNRSARKATGAARRPDPRSAGPAAPHSA
ncbi:hypothetical protein Maq22A_c28165 [Methylobacterium aquaticum]|uniref:Uncharacterized protein n=1 Tax=Methylobacterium aquaticum TaxID=270351 RepID=A0A1Y0Z8N0_9HYPH|nr:hypothetical protein Maq22A_c28165 [Methylobacterium aquaticum]